MYRIIINDSSDRSSTISDPEEECQFEICTSILPYQFDTPPHVVKSDESTLNFIRELNMFDEYLTGRDDYVFE